jgi:hypothetical protein
MNVETRYVIERVVQLFAYIAHVRSWVSKSDLKLSFLSQKPERNRFW